MVDIDIHISKATVEYDAMISNSGLLTEERQKLFATMRTHCDAFRGMFLVWSGANKVMQEDTTSTFENVISGTDAKFSSTKAAWLETAPEIMDLKSWDFLQEYATACLSKCNAKQALDNAVATGKDFRKDAIAYCRAYRKAISDTQGQIAKLAKEQAKDVLETQRDESRQQEEIVAANAVEAASSTPPAITPRANTPTVLGIFAAAGGIIPELTMFTVAEASEFNREWLLEKIKNSEIATDDQVNKLPYGLVAPSVVKEALAEGAAAAAFGRFMADFIGSAEYHGPLGRGTCTLPGVGSLAKQLRAMIVMHKDLVLLPRSLLDKELKAPQQRAHMEQMFGAESISAWGIAPNRSQALPEILGFGVFKVQCCGFCNLIVMDFLKCAEVFEQNPDLRNGFDGVFLTVTMISDLVKGLQQKQIGTFAAAMAPNAIYKTTLGAGSMVIIPPGALKNMFNK